MNDRFCVVPWGFNWNSIVATPGFSAESDNLYKMLEKEHQVNMTGCIGSGKTTLAFLMCKEHNINKVFRVTAYADDLKQCIINNWHACTVSHEQLVKTRYNIDAIPKPSYETYLHGHKLFTEPIVGTHEGVTTEAVTFVLTQIEL